MASAPLVVSFVAGREGPWRIDRVMPVAGESVPRADRLQVIEGGIERPAAVGDWILRGVVSNTRYTNRSELDALIARQEDLNRPQAARAA